MIGRAPDPVESVRHTDTGYTAPIEPHRGGISQSGREPRNRPDSPPDVAFVVHDPVAFEEFEVLLLE
jgi:hypothetical protein